MTDKCPLELPCETLIKAMKFYGNNPELMHNRMKPGFVIYFAGGIRKCYAAEMVHPDSNGFCSVVREMDYREGR